MKKRSILAGLALSLLAATASYAGDVRILWYSDGVEGEVLQDLLNRFMEQNPDIHVTLDNVAYTVIQEQLPIQLEASTGPDIVRVTNLKAQSQHWLDLRPYLQDPETWEANFGDQADWMRPDGSDALTGFMTQITLTGGYANATLFEQAGVEMPGEGATWEDWVTAASEVAQSQQVPFAVALDRSGHRITAPDISYGANYIGENGMPAPLDQGAKDFITQFVEWNNEGLISKDVWVSAAGSTYRAAADDFINGQLVFYYSGSWQIPNFATKIGDAFDWVATGSPCGPAACSGMPGGAGLVAVKYTQNPEDVAKVMEWLGSEEIVREFSERTLFLPAHKAVVAAGLDFQTEDPQVSAALDKFVEASATTSPVALTLPGWRWSDAYYGALVTRVSQVIAGELSLEDAFRRIDEDVAAKVAEATR